MPLGIVNFGFSLVEHPFPNVIGRRECNINIHYHGYEVASKGRILKIEIKGVSETSRLNIVPCIYGESKPNQIQFGH